MSEFIGFKNSNNLGLDFIVIEKSDKKIDGRYLYTVEFIETGYVSDFSKKHIKSGKIKDRLNPSIYNVACVGLLLNPTQNYKREYSVWYSMIRRCYDINHQDYKSYGGKSVSVCKRWLRFDLFLEDIINVEGFDRSKFLNGDIQLDKDYKQRGLAEKEYSLEMCKFLSPKENNDLKYEVKL